MQETIIKLSAQHNHQTTLKAVGGACWEERHPQEREEHERGMGSENQQTSVYTCMKISKNKINLN